METINQINGCFNIYINLDTRDWTVLFADYSKLGCEINSGDWKLLKDNLDTQGTCKMEERWFNANK